MGDFSVPKIKIVVMINERKQELNANGKYLLSHINELWIQNSKPEEYKFSSDGSIIAKNLSNILRHLLLIFDVLFNKRV